MLPYSIDYLMALPTKSQTRMIYEGASQTIVAAVPPLFDYTFSMSAFNVNAYALIVFKSIFSPVMVPNAFYVSGQEYGNQTYVGTVTTQMMNVEFYGFTIMTESKPSYLRIFNTTNFAQYYEGMAFFLTIPDEETYNEAFKALLRLSTSEEIQSAVNEATGLLKLMAIKAGVPAGVNYNPQTGISMAKTG